MGCSHRSRERRTLLLLLLLLLLQLLLQLVRSCCVLALPVELVYWLSAVSPALNEGEVYIHLNTWAVCSFTSRGALRSS